MRAVIIALVMCVGACASGGAAGGASIEVFYGETMKYSIEDGGPRVW